MQAMTKTTYLPPVQLLVGPTDATERVALQKVQSLICTAAGCARCTICCSLARREHQQLSWLAPEQYGYTHASLERAYNAITYAADDDKPSVIVMPCAEQLSAATANRLLKLLEEPPANLYVFLLTERSGMVLATLRSRCIEAVVAGPTIAAAEVVPSALFACFTALTINPALVATLHKELAAITPHGTITLLDGLLSHWYTQLHEDNDDAPAMLRELMKAYEQPPLSGGTTLFWRQLLLRCLALKRQQIPYS